MGAALLAALWPAWAQQPVSLAKPEGLYIGLWEDDPQQENLMLWRFRGNAFSRLAGDIGLVYNTSRALLLEEPDGLFEWNGSELIIKVPGDEACKPGECVIVTVIPGPPPQRPPVWRADAADAPFQTRVGAHIYRIGPAPADAAKGCFILQGAQLRRRVCPAPRFPQGLKIEGVYIQRQPADASEPFNPEAIVFWKNQVFKHEGFTKWYEEEPPYGRLLVQGEYRFAPNTLGLLKAGNRIVYSSAAPLGEWIDRETPRSLYIFGRVFDYAGRPTMPAPALSAVR